MTWVILTIPGEYQVGYYVNNDGSTVSMFKTTSVVKAISLVSILNGAEATEDQITALISSEDVQYIDPLPGI